MHILGEVDCTNIFNKIGAKQMINFLPGAWSELCAGASGIYTYRSMLWSVHHPNGMFDTVVRAWTGFYTHST